MYINFEMTLNSVIQLLVVLKINLRWMLYNCKDNMLK